MVAASDVPSPKIDEDGRMLVVANNLEGSPDKTSQDCCARTVKLTPQKVTDGLFHDLTAHFGN